MSAGELIQALQRVPPTTWVCLKDGPVNHIVEELGANEPYVVLCYVTKERCDLLQEQMKCSHLWKDGWCSLCGLGWVTWSSTEIARLREEIERLKGYYQAVLANWRARLIMAEKDRDALELRVEVLGKVLVPVTTYCNCSQPLHQGEHDTGCAQHWPMIQEAKAALRGGGTG